MLKFFIGAALAYALYWAVMKLIKLNELNKKEQELDNAILEGKEVALDGEITRQRLKNQKVTKTNAKLGEQLNED